MRRTFFLAAGAVLLTATMAVAEPGKGNSAGGKGPPDNPGGNGKGAGKGGNAGANPAADFGNPPGYPAGAAGIALFKSFDKNLTEPESSPPEFPLPEAKPFTLY